MLPISRPSLPMSRAKSNQNAGRTNDPEFLSSSGLFTFPAVNSGVGDTMADIGYWAQNTENGAVLMMQNPPIMQSATTGSKLIQKPPTLQVQSHSNRPSIFWNIPQENLQFQHEDPETNNLQFVPENGNNSRKRPTGKGTYIKKYFRCQQCFYLTDRKNNLKRHVATMHSECGKVLQCCDVTFRSKAALREHVLVYHRSGYRCKFCARNFCRKALLKRHLAVHLEQSGTSTSGSSKAAANMQQKRLAEEAHKYMPSVYMGLNLHSGVFPNPEPHDVQAPGPSRISRPWEDGKPQKCRVKGVNKIFSFHSRIHDTHGAANEIPPSSSANGGRNIDDRRSITDDGSQQSTSGTARNLLKKEAVADSSRICTEPYKCAVCGLAFPWQQSLSHHVRVCGGNMTSLDHFRPLRHFTN